MFIVSLTIIYIYNNNNYETEHKIKNKLSKNIINYINSDIKLKSIFNHLLDMFIVSLTSYFYIYNNNK